MLKELDGFRALAVGMVVLFHVGFYFKALPGFDEVVGTGYFGVQIFFILSSLLLTRQYLIYYPASTDKKQYTLTFFKKRFVRIIPLFLFSSVVIAAFNYKKIDFNLGNVLLYIFFIKDNLHINPVIWSLFVEVRFYILLPALMALLFFLNKYKLSVYIIPVLVILYCYAYRYVELTYYYDKDVLERLYSSLSANIDCLGLGMLVAILYEKYKSVTFKPQTVTIIAGVLLVFIYLIMHLRYHKYFPDMQRFAVPVNNLLWSALVLAVMLGKTTIFNKVLSSKIAVHISLISYSIYLWHLQIRIFILYILKEVIKMSSGKTVMVAQFALTIILSIIISNLTYRFVEKPFLNRKAA